MRIKRLLVGNFYFFSNLLLGSAVTKELFDLLKPFLNSSDLNDFTGCNYKLV